MACCRWLPPRLRHRRGVPFLTGSVRRVCAARGPGCRWFTSRPSRGAQGTVVANLALAIAMGARVLVVDDTADGDLTARLLPGTRTVGGSSRCWRTAGADGLRTVSPFNSAVTVLGWQPGAARDGRSPLESDWCAAHRGQASFDVVLVGGQRCCR
jgi:hypothetical protein